MATEVRFPSAPDSISQRHFLPEFYLRKNGEQIEIGVANRGGFDYAWALITPATLDAALALLKTEE